jgi:hypothetical protein
MVLHIPIASEYLYDYLDKHSGDPTAPIFFSLYSDLRYYDNSCSDEKVDEVTKYQKAIEIKDDFLNENGRFNIDIDPDVKRAIDNKFTNL